MRPLIQNDILDCKKLFKEWFPLTYPESWYNKILSKQRVIALGYFVKINVPVVQSDHEEEKNLDEFEEVEVIIGALIS